MSRSIWKGPFSELYSLSAGKRVNSRRSMVLPEHVGLQVSVHNGLRFIPLKITQQMAGHKFGEFALTRKKPQHKRKKKKK